MRAIVRGEGKEHHEHRNHSRAADRRRRRRPAGPRIAVSALVSNLRDYGLVLALIVIMIFFQFTTNGTLFKPVNLTQPRAAEQLHHRHGARHAAGDRVRPHRPQRRLGRRLHRRARGHDDGRSGRSASSAIRSSCRSSAWSIGGAIGAAQGYWIAYHRIPSFIVTLAGMLIFRGMCQALLGGGSSVGPLPADFKALSSGFIPD